ncbi:hybrid sensor histidine kinase/response regulator [Thalassospira sp. CH_XMU1420-2]|uniref:hybrid sensor histidine kinase/response regulator n=1 Tax=Thalassospira sp. CH_XMU1420-2 TaxID=3107769 RepID=UPI003009AAAD
MCLLSAASGFIFFYEKSVEQEVFSDTNQDLQQLLAQGRSVLFNDLYRFRDNLSFLHATPPVSGLTRAESNGGIDPFDGTSFDQWKLRLETIFIAMLHNNASIDQLRIIRTNDAGSELVRVNRRGGNIYAVPDQMLQDKGTTDYFAHSAALKPDELFVSRINLNQEFGQIEYPIRPTLRLSLPIFNEDGTRFGFLIMNINAQNLLARLQKEVTGDFEIILTDDDGFYIAHPLEEYRFSRDLLPEHRWDKDYDTRENEQTGLITATELSSNRRFYIQASTIQFASNPASVLHLYAAIASQRVADVIWKRRLSTYGFAAVSIIIMTITLLLLLRGYRNSIHLADARAEHEAIIRSSSDGVIGLKRSGTVSSVNETAEKMFGINPNAVIGRNIADLNILPDVDFSDKIKQVATSRVPLSFDATFSSSSSAEKKELLLTCSPIVSDSRGITGVAVIARDVTQERVAERQIRRANAELEEKVAKRTEELAEAHQKALQVSDMKSAFISNVSHEMRTPLNGMVGAHKLIQREPLTESQQKYLQMAETSCSTLTTLINDILDLSKIEAGKLEFENKPFNTLELFEAIASSSAIRSREKGIELILDTVDLEHIELYGDTTRLKQLLNNLVGNAIKFTDKGYVGIYVASRSDGERVRLDVSIEDSGIGILDKNKEKLFTAFTQEDTSISSEFGGTGLGLSICRQLCELMGGAINFDSSKGNGSRFFFHVYFDAKTAKERFVPRLLKDKYVLVDLSHEQTFIVVSRQIKRLGGDIINMKTDTVSGHIHPIIDIAITDQTDGGLEKFCSFLESLSLNGTQLPHLLIVQNFRRNQLKYKGKTNWLSEPINYSELVANLDPKQRQQNTLSMSAQRKKSPPDKVGKAQQSTSETTALLDKVATILIVDDNAINIEVAKGLLSGMDFTLLTATNGAEALEIMRYASEPIHAVLMDCQMPGMDGFEATKQIRSGILGPVMSNIPIIAMTANAMSGEKEKCLDAGMNDYITKPIEPDRLVNKVMHWVQKQLAKSQGPVDH